MAYESIVSSDHFLQLGRSGNKKQYIAERNANVKPAALTIQKSIDLLFSDITAQIAAWLESAHVRAGLLTVFVPHTSASLTIQENADPDVVHDLNAFFNRLVV